MLLIVMDGSLEGTQQGLFGYKSEFEVGITWNSFLHSVIDLPACQNAVEALGQTLPWLRRHIPSTS